MLTYPSIDPVIISFGPAALRWYGLMYLIGFAAAWILGRKRARRTDSPITPRQLDDLVFYCALGVIFGAKLGYLFFYNFGGFIENPLSALRLWEAGMSFHGGFIGVLLVLLIYSRRKEISMLRLVDFAAPLVPIGLGAGRLGNFINGELWGRVSDLPWAMVYPPLGMEPRHPSQLYQMGLEGIALFIILWWYSSRPRSRGAVSGIFLAGYGLFRGFVEFFRMPDSHIGYLAFGWLTMGQLLTLPMIIIGLVLIFRACRAGDPSPS